MKKIFLILSLLLMTSLSLSALAQDKNLVKIKDNIINKKIALTNEGSEINSMPLESSEELNTDNNDVTAEDLGVNEPKIPPGHWIYGIKRAWQGLKIAFTFNTIAKTKLRARYLNEDIIGIQKKLENTDSEKISNRLLKIYQKRSDKLEEAIEKIEKKTAISPEMEKLLKLTAQNQLKHIVVLSNLIEKLPEKATETIIAVKERQIERFIDKTEKIELRSKGEKVLEKIMNSENKNSQKLEIIKNEIRTRKEIFQGLGSEERQQVREIIKKNVKKQFEKKTKVNSQNSSTTTEQDESQPEVVSEEPDLNENNLNNLQENSVQNQNPLQHKSIRSEVELRELLQAHPL